MHNKYTTATGLSCGYASCRVDRFRRQQFCQGLSTPSNVDPSLFGIYRVTTYEYVCTLCGSFDP